MFGAIKYRRLRISTAINGVSLLKSRPYLRFLSSASSSSVTSSENELQKDQSFTVSYLVNSCGLTPEAAIVASEKVRLRNSETADSVLAFLREQMLSNAQISNVIKKRPRYLLSDPANSFLPKVEFFYSKGVSKETMAKALSSNAYVLQRSLSNCIVPVFDLLKSLSASDEQVLYVLKHRVSIQKHGQNVFSNVRLLQGLGISNSRIVSVFVNFPCLIVLEPERFTEVVKKITDMGFDPYKAVFLFALRTFSMACYEKRWRENFEVYAKWGWSESDIISAYKYHPDCMAYSKEKIDKSMDYLVNVMGHPTMAMARCPVILCYSLEKRIRPRCSVFGVLSRKGLVKRGKSKLYGLLTIKESAFLEKYVTRFEKEVPLLMSVYQGKVQVDDA